MQQREPLRLRRRLPHQHRLDHALDAGLAQVLPQVAYDRVPDAVRIDVQLAHAVYDRRGDVDKAHPRAQATVDSLRKDALADWLWRN